MRVLVTGGSRGIGRACVERFCADGHRVAFLYRSSHEAAKELSRRTGAVAIQADLSEPSVTEAAIASLLRDFGGIDILINNAGIAQVKLFTDLTNEDWRAMLENNLSSTFYVTHAVAPAMIAEKFGRIINIGSMWGKTGASCEVHYSATKAALRGMTMALAKDFGPSGITVNCIEPGVIDTDMNSDLTEEDFRELCEKTPLGRIGTPEEVASLAAFLASGEAGFITGQAIGIDGGFAV